MNSHGPQQDGGENEGEMSRYGYQIFVSSCAIRAM